MASTSSKEPIKVGDWVRFYSNGKLVIGVVNYIGRESTRGDIEVMTDIGAIDSESILEARHD
jgi:hypothetical protein